MLYISRYIGKHRYGVYDTDDGVEEEVSKQDLTKVACIFGIDIEGIVYKRTTIMGGMRIIDTVSPYQSVDSVSSLQTKTLMLYGVDIKTWKNMITSVRYDVGRVTAPVDIRLSDFGSVVADRILFGNSESSCGKVTLILDDKLQYSEYSLVKPVLLLGKKQGLGVLLDLNELSDDNALFVYSALGRALKVSEIPSVVVDKPSRVSRMMNMVLDFVAT